MDCSVPGSFVHRVSQARIWEWVSISFLKASSPPGDRTCVSAGGFFIAEPAGKPSCGCTCFFFLAVISVAAGNKEKNHSVPYIFPQILSIKSVQSLSHVWLFATTWTAALRPDFPVHHQLLELAQTHVIKSVMPSNHLILLSSSPPVFSLSQHQVLFQRVGSLHQVAKVLELQHRSFQWTLSSF